MSNDKRSGPWTEEDYELIEHAVMETDRGRWFLREHALRNRNAETQVILNALNRLEHKIGRSVGEPRGIESLRRALTEMADAIHSAKAEIGSETEGEESETLGGATVELDAIVRATEKATSDILYSAERVQEIAWTMREQGASESVCDALDQHATDIYSACSFQDLTGQRTQKVVQILRFIEGRLHALIDLWGDSARDEDLPPRMSLVTTAINLAPTVTAAPVEDDEPETATEVPDLEPKIQDTSELAPEPEQEPFDINLPETFDPSDYGDPSEPDTYDVSPPMTFADSVEFERIVPPAAAGQEVEEGFASIKEPKSAAGDPAVEWTEPADADADDIAGAPEGGDDGFDDPSFVRAEDALNAAMASHLLELSLLPAKEDNATVSDPVSTDAEPVGTPTPPTSPTIEDIDGWSKARKIAFFS